jgi:small subunit ribosomal protein S11
MKKKEIIILYNLYIKSNLKNTIINLTKEGKNLKQWSTKSFKKTKIKKNSSYNIYLLSLKIIQYLKSKKIKEINIFINGTSKGKTNIIKNFDQKGIKIFYIFNRTKISFNGCKKKKTKRH